MQYLWRKLTSAALIAVLLAIMQLRATADTLRLNDGEKMTGSLVNISNGSLAFRTRLAGKLFVPIDEVMGVSTRDFVIMTLADGRVLFGRLAIRDGHTYLVDSINDEQRRINLSEVSKIASLPSDSEATEADPAKLSTLQLGVTLETGYRFRQGAVDFSGPTASVSVNSALGRTEVDARVSVEYTDDGGALDGFFEAKARVVHDTAKKWKPEVMFELERDRNKALDLRYDLTVGVGRRVIDSQRQTLRVGAGFGIEVERRDPEPLRRDQGKSLRHFLHEKAENNEELNLNLNFRYTRLLFGNTLFEGVLVMRPSLSNPGEVRARSESALLVPLSPSTKLKFDVLVDYEDETRYRGIDEVNTAIGASLRIRF